jgi:triosephosphate isomerase
MKPMFVGASLKMYLDHAATLQWVTAAAAIAGDHPAVADGRVDVVVLPTFVSIEAVSRTAGDSGLQVGAQDVAWADSGPYTGEVSAVDLAALGCRYVEIGHAERRAQFGEDDKIIAAKLAAAARHGLTPMLCVGETEPTSATAAAEFCLTQVGAALAEMGDGSVELIIAYEPVWAIGAERPADADHVRQVCRLIRDGLDDDHRLATVRIIYGGSAGPGTLTDLGQAVDGIFLGRFAHDPEAFGRVVDEADLLTSKE